jgi:hypothetical protein
VHKKLRNPIPNSSGNTSPRDLVVKNAGTVKAVDGGAVEADAAVDFGRIVLRQAEIAVAFHGKGFVAAAVAAVGNAFGLRAEVGCNCQKSDEEKRLFHDGVLRGLAAVHP